MTAVMIARVIDSGKLSFDTTLSDALPDIEMRDDYRKVTIAQLLTFTGGIQPYTRIGPMLTPILFELKGSPAEQRKQFVKHVLHEEPVVKPGSERKYSNASYVVAAFVASRRTGRGWEALMEDEVFKPLRLTKAGFGRPRSKERPDEPWLHRKGEKGYEPEPEEPQAEPGTLAGAGGVACSIRDFAKFASHKLSAAQGKDGLLKPGTAKRLRELSQNDTAEGRPLFGGTPWMTAGFALWPSKNTAVVVAVNGGSAVDACTAVFKAVENR
jgi:CubicO group peptidase (beta-lactamase class C family)